MNNLDLKDIEKLIADFNESPSRELEIKMADFQLHLSKNELSGKLLQQLQQPIQTTKQVSTTDNPSNASAENQNVNSEQTAKKDVIKAPMVGSVFLQPAPGKEPYVKVGSRVAVGDVVCVIEAMKVMTEIKSERSAVISRVLVKNEELIEYGQPLFELED
ncbi:MAG: acetyl-CoA carboxylase biotin carboxyl carrier protein [Liquorilactobacillus nagelii]|nr:acetyl-CoA carboxylase biotin carboxyl carrier protein [Liquorilactobacillus nagelii]KRL40527.1 biotin carboxyl carrier protein of acetyl-CoA carboxylase [Liquorilactobacillus nagelii DSM 13675]